MTVGVQWEYFRMKSASGYQQEDKSPRSKRRISFTVRGKMVIGFLSIIVLLMAVFGVGFYGLSLSKEVSNTVIQAQQTEFIWSSWTGHILRMINDYQYYLFNADGGLKDDAAMQWNLAKIEADKLRQIVEDSKTLNTMIGEADSIHTQLDELTKSNQVALLGIDSTAGPSSRISEDLAVLLNQMNNALSQSQSQTVANQDNLDRLHGLSLIMIMIASMAVLIAVCITVLVPRNISRNFQAINRVIDKMAAGDLTAEIPKEIDVEVKDEIGAMAKSCSKTQKYLLDLVTMIKENAIQLTAASEQLETAAKQSSESAPQAAQESRLSAGSAVSEVEKSTNRLEGMDKIKEASTEVARKMEEMGTRSSEIGKIVAVIDDIAAQTNLLALNAAIEAARTGEQGRGFAAVSDQVRNLAERSAAATREIANLVSSIQKGVKEVTQVTLTGSSAVSESYSPAMEAGQSLKSLLKAPSDVNQQVKPISNKAPQVKKSTNELVKVIDKVGSIKEQNDPATGQMTGNAAHLSKAVETEEVSGSMSGRVREMLASAQNLKEMAASLESSVAKFKMKKDIDIHT
jgi:methyl-accepting chemotaxis protein